LAVAFLNHLDSLMLTSMRDSVDADIVMTDAQCGLLTSVFLWVYGSLSPLLCLMASMRAFAVAIFGMLM